MVGKKRVRKNLKKVKPESECEDQEETEKRKKVEDNKSEKIKKPRVKKGPKIPTEYKKGKWNPHVELIECDKIKEDSSDELITGCCIRCNCRNIHRAINIGNNELLKSCLNAYSQISNLNSFWSPDSIMTPLDVLLNTNKDQLFETLMVPKLDVPIDSTYDIQRR